VVVVPLGPQKGMPALVAKGGSGGGEHT
jgi:hypothetical protein